MAPCKISFFKGRVLTNYQHFKGNISLRDFQLRKSRFIIGLNILVNCFHECTITPLGISFLGVPFLPFTSAILEEHNGAPTLCCCNNCNPNKPCGDKVSENLEEFSKYSLLMN